MKCADQVNNKNDASTICADDITKEMVESYRRDGFVSIKNVLSTSSVEKYYEAALDAHRNLKDNCRAAVLDQFVNTWPQNDLLRELTLNARIGQIAQKLAGVKLRLWHDHLLIKSPHNNAPTEFHQDQPYWPHADSTHPVSVWIALCDVPANKGCMSFIPGSQKYTALPDQDLTDEQSLFSICPPLQWEPRVTLPLKAGDCTFHHGCIAHMANANATNDPRVAHIVIYIDETTTYTGAKHVVTDPMNLAVGDKLQGEYFPLVDDFSSLQ